jgi:hypothetical protein
MTGRLYGRLGIFPGVLSPLSVSGLQLNATTIAASLKTVGYTTGGLGFDSLLFFSLAVFPPLFAHFRSRFGDVCSKWHLGTHQYLPPHHGFDYYFGAPMTQNECISNIRTPGSAKPPPGHSPFGAISH